MGGGRGEDIHEFEDPVNMKNDLEDFVQAVMFGMQHKMLFFSVFINLEQGDNFCCVTRSFRYTSDCFKIFLRKSSFDFSQTKM